MRLRVSVIVQNASSMHFYIDYYPINITAKTKKYQPEPDFTSSIKFLTLRSLPSFSQMNKSYLLIKPSIALFIDH